MQYKGFVGSVVFNVTDEVFHGKVEFITNLVTFGGAHIEEMVQAFEEAVEDYIELREALGRI